MQVAKSLAIHIRISISGDRIARKRDDIRYALDRRLLVLFEYEESGLVGVHGCADWLRAEAARL
jgi:hypothetical protein